MVCFSWWQAFRSVERYSCKMKVIRFFAFVLLFCIGFVANAEYLYWQLDDFALKSGSTDVYVKDGFEFSFARLVAFSSDSAQVMNLHPTIYPQWDPSSEDPAYAVADLSTLTSVENYSFYIELVLWDGSSDSVTAISDIQTYTSLNNSGYISADIVATPSNLWHGTSYMVPEPSGGLLVLIGTGLLALRRRKSKEC